MPYSAMTYRLLISSPGDVPVEDLAIIRDAINRWNGVYGHQVGSVILPISWGTHAAAAFGGHPQEIINDQLVDDCDMCIALFANRMGTETHVAESGTAEEIERIHKAGNYVAVLRCRRPVSMASVDLEQAGRLEDYMKSLQGAALVLSYENEAELQRHVDNVLSNAITQARTRAEVQLETTPDSEPVRVAEVWPRVESEPRVKTDSKGRVKTSRNWYLVLANTGDAPARDVRFRTEAEGSESGDAWFVHGNKDGETIESVAPQGEIRFAIFATFGSAQQVRCTVTWTDDRGERSNSTTLRLV
jgi:hypothetical protein